MNTMTSLIVLLMAPFSQALAMTAGTTFSFGDHKEQVKNESGAESGAIFQHTYAALGAHGLFSVLPNLELGAFVLGESGSRSFAPYTGTNAQNNPSIGTRTGGTYKMFWTGPAARGTFGPLFLELGYALIGLRWDKYYGNLKSSTGDANSAFQSKLGRAFLMGAGLRANLSAGVFAMLKVEYRFHYYGGRGGDELEKAQLLGTQAIRPHFGIEFSL